MKPKKTKQSKPPKGVIKTDTETYTWTGKVRVKQPRKRNRKAQDATLINVDALKKRVARLEAYVAHLLEYVCC